MATRTVYGYKWSNEQQAMQAKNAAKVHFGYPVAPGCLTTNAIEPDINYDAEGNILFWYYEGDLSPVFGSIQEFEINVFEPV